jgi:general secretion pathway protein C
LSSSTPDNSQLLGKYRDALLNDPNSMMGLVNVRPYQKDGRLVGYRIRPGRDRALLRRFGLRSGDIITSVNGVPMNNPVKALEVLRDLSSATQLTVDIQRNGTPQSFTFQIQ